MAEESGGSSWWETWGVDLISSVRSKSAEAMTMVKHDLTEFVNTIHQDTSAVVADTASSVKEKLKVDDEDEQGGTALFKQGVSKLLGTISSTLRENISQVATVASGTSSDGPEPIFDRMQARLNEIQTDPATFCTDPDGHLGLFQDWCMTFDLDQNKGEISELLVNIPEIRALYAKLVPSAVTHALFWQRYFYKVHQLQQEEKKRAAIVARANQTDDYDLGWGDEDLWDTEEIDADSLKHHSSDQTGTERGTSASEEPENENSVPSEDASTEVEKMESGNHTLNDRKALGQEPTEIVNTQQQSEPGIKLSGAEERASTLDKVKNGEVSDIKTQKLLGQDNVENLDSGGAGAEVSLPETSEKRECQDVTDSMGDVQQGDAELSGESIECPASKEKTTTFQSWHKRENSNGSVDSSWSKLSEGGGKGLKTSNVSAPSPATSSSSSSGVLVPNVSDKDLEWDDELNLDEDMSEEEVKRIMESMANKQIQDDDADLDEDDWENWD